MEPILPTLRQGCKYSETGEVDKIHYSPYKTPVLLDGA
jgi:hypothetical protein